MIDSSGGASAIGTRGAIESGDAAAAIESDGAAAASVTGDAAAASVTGAVASATDAGGASATDAGVVSATDAGGASATDAGGASATDPCGWAIETGDVEIGIAGGAVTWTAAGFVPGQRGRRPSARRKTRCMRGAYCRGWGTRLRAQCSPLLPAPPPLPPRLVWAWRAWRPLLSRHRPAGRPR